MSNQVKDGIAGSALMIFAVVYRVLARDIQVFQGMGATVISSKTIPYMWSYILMLLSGLLIIRSMKGINLEAGRGEPLFTWNVLSWIKSNYAVLMTFLILAVYAMSIQWAGYLLSTLIYLPLQILLLTKKGRYKRIWRGGLILSVLFTFFSYIVFAKFLSINLPKGVW